MNPSQPTDVVAIIKEAMDIAQYFSQTHAFTLAITRRLDEFTSAEYRFTALPNQNFNSKTPYPKSLKPSPPTATPTSKAVNGKRAFAIAAKAGWTSPDVVNFCKQLGCISGNTNDLTWEQYQDFMAHFGETP